MSNNQNPANLVGSNQFYIPLYWNPETYCFIINPYFATSNNFSRVQLNQCISFEAQKLGKQNNIYHSGLQSKTEQKNLDNLHENKERRKKQKKQEIYTNKNTNQAIESKTYKPATIQIDQNESQLCHLGFTVQVGKTNWSTQEQQKLKQLVNLFGKRWKYISQHFPDRTGKQIRERYLNYLRPNLSLKKWSKEEDDHILQLVSKYGRSWRTIEKKLKNRSQNQIKNRFYGHLQKLLKTQSCQKNQVIDAHFKKQQLKTDINIRVEQQQGDKAR